MTHNITVSKLLAGTVVLTLMLSLVPMNAYAGAPGCTLVGGSSVEIMLVIDGSGSIAAADFTAQKAAYAAAVALVPTDGSVALGVIQFSTGVAVEHPLTVINSVADRNAVIASINAMGQAGGLTNISAGITAAENQLIPGNGFTRQIIDVSTDGFHNQGGLTPQQAANQAVANGVEQVNTLGIGVATNFNAGVGSFNLQVMNFGQDLEDALIQKLQQELQCLVAGEILSIDTTALFVSGVSANAVWLLPMLAGIVGTGAYFTRNMWNKSEE